MRIRRTSAPAVAALTLAALLSTTPASAAPARPPAGTALPAATATTAISADASVPPTPDEVMAARLDARVTPAAFGTRFTGQVVDVASGAVVWGRSARWGLAPASTTKLVTAGNALSVLGPAYRITTAVRRGTSWSHVVLVGGGDPSLAGADLRTLVTTTTAQLRRHHVSRVKVWVDDSLFPAPTLATGWLAKDVPTDVSAVRALVVDRHHAPDTSLDAGAVFAAKLRAAGITVIAVGHGRAPAGAATIATVRGARLDAIISHMLLTSDNDDAEALHRLVSLQVGGGAGWAAAAAAQRAELAAQGVVLAPTQLYDGSGLSRRDRLSASQLVALVVRSLDPASTSAPLATALPVAGLTGTLRAAYGRFSVAPSSCAAGLVHAKTGTLDQAVALAGWTTGADGRVKAFAFVVNGAGDSLRLKRRVDNLAATVTGCY